MKDPTILNFPSTDPQLSKDDIEKYAEGWFDKVFREEESQAGYEEKQITVTDYNGGNYTVTIDLLFQGKESGNTGSLSISADKKLISAAFIHSDFTFDELKKPIVISDKEAIERARAIVTEEIIGKDQNVLVTFDNSEVLSCRFRVFHNHRFWEIEESINISSGSITDDVVYYLIRIDADTGECLEAASSLK